MNRQPAAGYYIWNERAGAYVPITIDVLRISGGQITEVTISKRARG